MAQRGQGAERTQRTATDSSVLRLGGGLCFRLRGTWGRGARRPLRRRRASRAPLIARMTPFGRSGFLPNPKWKADRDGAECSRTSRWSPLTRPRRVHCTHDEGSDPLGRSVRQEGIFVPAYHHNGCFRGVTTLKHKTEYTLG